MRGKRLSSIRKKEREVRGKGKEKEKPGELHKILYTFCNLYSVLMAHENEIDKKYISSFSLCRNILIFLALGVDPFNFFIFFTIYM